MMATGHWLTAAMVWHNEPIKLHILSPVCRQVGDYHCCKDQSPLWCLSACTGDRVDTQPLPSKPNPDDGPQIELTRDVWGLDDYQLLEVLEALQKEMARKEWGKHPHMGYPREIRGSWGQQWGQHGWWESGPQRGKGWRYSKPVQQPTSPSQADTDASCLLSALMARLRKSIPRINTFSGVATPGKTEMSFEQGYQRAQCVKDQYPEAVVWEGIIQLLKGVVANMARYMGPPLALPMSCTNYQLFLAWWPPLMFSCRTSKRSPRVIMRRSPPLPWGRRDPQPNPTPVPQKDDVPGGPTALQGSPLSWGPKTHLQLCLVLVWYPWYLIFTTNGGHPEGREQKWGDLGKSKG